MKPPVEDQGPKPPPPEADKVFVFKTVIFNGSAAVLHGMMYYFVFLHLFNVAPFLFNVARLVFINTLCVIIDAKIGPGC